MTHNHSHRDLDANLRVEENRVPLGFPVLIFRSK